MDLASTPSFLTFSQDEIETVIPSESNEHLSIKKTKTSSCGLNPKIVTAILFHDRTLDISHYNTSKRKKLNILKNISIMKTHMIMSLIINFKNII
jgi:hypothetical protein